MKTRHQAHLSLAFPRFHKLSSKRETCTLASEQNSPPNRRRSFPFFSLLSPSSRQKNHFFFFSFSLSFLLCDDHHLYHSRINHVARIIFLFLSKLGIESIEKRKKWRCFQLFHSKQLAKSWAQLESYSRDNLLLRSPRGTRDEERAPSLYKTSV